jgi:hypothetical protein
MRIKDLYLSFLNENKEDFFYLDEGSIKDINDVSLSKDSNYVRIDFNTTYGKPMSVVTDYDKFMEWYKEGKKKDDRPEELFKRYVERFIKLSSETEPFFANMNEIIDDFGAIMPSTDMPSNANNRMVGDKIRWDLEMVYRSSIPKRIRFYSGESGIGIITW